MYTYQFKIAHWKPFIIQLTDSRMWQIRQAISINLAVLFLNTAEGRAYISRSKICVLPIHMIPLCRVQDYHWLYYFCDETADSRKHRVPSNYLKSLLTFSITWYTQEFLNMRLTARKSTQNSQFKMPTFRSIVFIICFMLSQVFSQLNQVYLYFHIPRTYYWFFIV